MRWQEDNAWHNLEVQQVLNVYESDGTKGLTPEEASKRLEEVGPNVVEGKKGPGAFVLFLQQFQHPLIYILLIAGAVTIFLPGHTVDALVIFGVVLINAIVGYLQESRAKAAIDALSKMVKVESIVVRNGESIRVDAADIVPGEVILLQSGDRVSADMRLIKVRDFYVDESMLTGESLPVPKEAKVVLDEGTVLADRRNMAYSGALVTYGQATGVVTSTGNRTELGRISDMIESATEIATPLTKKLTHFSKLLSWVIIGFATITFLLGALRGEPAIYMFIAAVALAVAAIPEGLPAAITIILSIGVTRMARRHAVIRKLPAVETLGSTSVICSDKTGTLTKNEMTVTSIFTGNKIYTVTGSGYASEGELLLDSEKVSPDISSALSECLLAGVLCNQSKIVESDGLRRVEGDPTEGALLPVAEKAGMDLTKLRGTCVEVDVIPFESERQYMASLNDVPGKGRFIYLKGAVEKVLGLCSKSMDDSGELNPIDCKVIQAKADSLAGQGLRVLAFAMQKTPDGQDTLKDEHLSGDMVFLGLQGMLDPPRPEAIEAIKACKTAGIAVKMITGDHALTAKTIAEQLGISDTGLRVITGKELEQTSEEDLPAIASKTHVFARVAPEQKLRLVEALQANEAVVAMTGDGVNDAPALKQANIGVAMGITGTEVSKQAADMVLTDDNFSSIEAAVEEGRGVYDNLRKFITWTLPTNAGEGLLILAAIVAGKNLIPHLPISPVQVLWINMTTALALGMMLAFEPKEKGLMLRPARDPNEPILTRVLLIRTLYVSVIMVIGAYILFFRALNDGMSIEASRAVAANVIVMVELIYLFNCRSLDRFITQVGIMTNKLAIVGALTMIGLQVAFTYVPFMQELFGTAAIPAIKWVQISGVALAVFGIVEIEKWARRRALAIAKARKDVVLAPENI